jgi:putative tryptophan/tyrosine transport system substrate-binding protein
MRRREFVALLAGSTLSLPVPAWAQQSTKVYRIAILHPSRPVTEMSETSNLPVYRAFFGELRRLGYIEQQNLIVERFSGEGRVDRYPEIARKAAALSPDVALAITVWMAKPLKAVAPTIPIVAITSDPVDAGLVSSLAKPGGNLTGVSVDPGLEIWGKRFQLFREIVPSIQKVALLALLENPERAAMLQTAEKVGISVVEPSFVEGGNDADYRAFFTASSRHSADALFVDGSPEHITKQQLISELAAEFRLPAIYPYRSFVEAGGLMAYGIDLIELFREAARSISKILTGAKPGDIPNYQPTKFEFLINLKGGQGTWPHCAALNTLPRRRASRMKAATSGIGTSRQAAFFGPTVANGALRTWLDLQLAPPSRD